MTKTFIFLYAFLTALIALSYFMVTRESNRCESKTIRLEMKNTTINKLEWDEFIQKVMDNIVRTNSRKKTIVKRVYLPNFIYARLRKIGKDKAIQDHHLLTVGDRVIFIGDYVCHPGYVRDKLIFVMDQTGLVEEIPINYIN